VDILEGAASMDSLFVLQMSALIDFETEILTLDVAVHLRIKKVQQFKITCSRKLQAASGEVQAKMEANLTHCKMSCNIAASANPVR